ncbi:MAG: aminoacyl-tRNA hydrolase [Thermoguttaceae bacterium]
MTWLYSSEPLFICGQNGEQRRELVKPVPGSKSMRIIVGLGNPGEKYRKTRHNVGYLVLSELATSYATGKPKAKFHADILDVRVKGENVLLLCPTTYMNNSGKSVLEATRYYNVSPENVLVVCDDFNLPFSRLRLRSEGSSGGQKGLQDICRVLGTEQVPRLRVGIGPIPDRIDPADYVLSNFNSAEMKMLPDVLKKGADAAYCFLTDGITEAMNQYNGSST